MSSFFWISQSKSESQRPNFGTGGDAIELAATRLSTSGLGTGSGHESSSAGPEENQNVTTVPTVETAGDVSRATVCFTSLFAASFTSDIHYLVFYQGVLHALGGGISPAASAFLTPLILLSHSYSTTRASHIPLNGSWYGVVLPTA
ncbi:hypothetical protein PIIN_11555 [Serendipita indica DSM 11827]|uniref:Uncharacterized protein n=1 Tax=Serendipita indica (strain DSM 11827) TaxID=1109443 RepID=G4U1Y5_SERID|nr:hypothetical protein PIIN_11555 [Serendipita indica DSM 11827]